VVNDPVDPVTKFGGNHQPRFCGGRTLSNRFFASARQAEITWFDLRQADGKRGQLSLAWPRNTHGFARSSHQWEFERRSASTNSSAEFALATSIPGASGVQVICVILISRGSFGIGKEDGGDGKSDTLKQPCLSEFLYGNVDRRAGSIRATWKVSIFSSNPFRSARSADTTFSLSDLLGN
jgi:hypothetical protein